MPEIVPDLPHETTCASRFTSVPTTIDAVQYTGDNLAEIQAWVGVRYGGDPFNRDGFIPVDEQWPVAPTGVTALIWDKLHDTWVGVKDGQWIIKGTKDEFYPCDDDVFRAKYASDADLELAEGFCEEAVAESSILLTQHPYAHNSYYLEHFTGALLLGAEDLAELYRQLDQHLYPNKGHETALPVSTRRG